MFIPLHDANPLKRIYFQFFTVGFILICIGVYLYTLTLSLDELSLFQQNFGMVPAELFGHRPSQQGYANDWWTPLTCIFLHADFWHLLGNLMFLWVFGDNVEDEIGHTRYLFFFAFCALVASGLQAGIDSHGYYIVVGISGAVSGVLGGYFILHPKQNVFVLILSRIPIILPSFLVIGGWAIFQLYHASISPAGGGIAWWAHVGGFVAGAGMMLLLRVNKTSFFGR